MFTTTSPAPTHGQHRHQKIESTFCNCIEVYLLYSICRQDSLPGQEILIAFIPSVGTVYSIPEFRFPVDLNRLCFEAFRRRVNRVMGVPNDYNGWGYVDSGGVLHWVDDNESYQTMLAELLSVGEILLMADEELPHVSRLFFSFLKACYSYEIVTELEREERRERVKL